MAHGKTNAVNETLRFPLADVFEKELTAQLDEGREIVLAMVDLDTFMRVNTDFGYEEGDRVLIETGRHILSYLPEDAKAYRYGGDEFALVFPETYEKEEVFLLMERMRGEYDIALPNGDKVSISAGIAAAQDDASTFLDLVRKAEGAMFRGKLNGRNRVCLAREEKMVTKTSHYTAEQLKRLTKVSKREGIGEAVLLREALDALLKKYDV